MESQKYQKLAIQAILAVCVYLLCSYFIMLLRNTDTFMPWYGMRMGDDITFQQSLQSTLMIVIFGIVLLFIPFMVMRITDLMMSSASDLLAPQNQHRRVEDHQYEVSRESEELSEDPERRRRHADREHSQNEDDDDDDDDDMVDPNQDQIMMRFSQPEEEEDSF